MTAPQLLGVGQVGWRKIRASVVSYYAAFEGSCLADAGETGVMDWLKPMGCRSQQAGTFMLLSPDLRQNGCIVPHFFARAAWMQIGLRVFLGVLTVVALVGGGCSSTGPRDLAYQSAYSAVGGQVK